MRDVLGHVAQGFASACAVAFLAYTQLPDDHTDAQITLAVIAIAWLGLESVARAGRGAWRAYRIDRQEKFREEVQNNLASAFVTIIRTDVRLLDGQEEEAGDTKPALFLDPADIGLNAFAVRWTLRLRRELVRISRLRLSAKPRPSPRIRWTRGKGLIGSCWANTDVEYVDTLRVWKRYVGCTRRDWRNAPRDTRMRLRYRDFRAIGTKYKGGVALPVLGENHTVVGVVALDLVASSPMPIECLWHSDVLQALQTAADHIGQLMRVAR